MQEKPFTLTRLGRLLAVLALGALAALPLRASDTVYVTTYTGSTLTADPPYLWNPLALDGLSYSGYGSTAIANPPGVPTRTKCVYAFGGVANWKIQPTLTPADGGVNGSVYRIEIAHTAVSSCTSNVVISAYSPDGTVSASCTNSTLFQKANGGDTWREFGYITNNAYVNQPSIIFYYDSGQLDNSGSPGNRLYIDAFKFTEVSDPCAGVVGDVTVTGPLAASQTFVNVRGVTEGATNVTVYADDYSEIGQANNEAGFAAGDLSVPTSALVKDQVIKAKQTKNGCTSTLLSSGPSVGGGANPQVKVSLGCVLNATLTGPAGADTTGAGPIQYWVKATGLSGGSATAQVGGGVVYPGPCWQTVTFNIAVPGIENDPKLFWAGGAVYAEETNAFCVLEHLAFALDTDVSDTGPYDIYVDKIMNGDLVIEDFEAWDVGAEVTFASPDTATLPPPAATYLSAPLSSAVSQVNAYAGTNSCRIRWQFANNLNIRWARVLASRANGATYPQLDTSKPVTVRFLVLPVGETAGKLSVGTVPDQAKTVGQSVTFTAAARGEGPFTYRWKKNGNEIDGATDSSYTIPSVVLNDAGAYAVVVDNDACEPVESSPAQLTVQVAPTPVTITGVAGTSLDYTGGSGTQFVLVKSSDVGADMSLWTRAATNTVTPGSFAIPIGSEARAFYRIKSE